MDLHPLEQALTLDIQSLLAVFRSLHWLGLSVVFRALVFPLLELQFCGS